MQFSKYCAKQKGSIMANPNATYRLYCQFCRRVFISKSPNTVACERPKCQADKIIRLRMMIRESRKASNRRKHEDTRAQGPKQKRHKRRCQFDGCNVLCWPNWIYCKTHHTIVSDIYADYGRGEG